MKLWESLADIKKYFKSRDVREINAMAVIDASTVFGANRYWTSVYSKKDWEFYDLYKESEDRLLFEEFLHNVLLYDGLCLDKSSMAASHHASLPGERVFEQECNLDDVGILTHVNNSLDGYYSNQFFNITNIAPETQLKSVLNVVCNLISKSCQNKTTLENLKSISIPWYYKAKSHYDRQAFEQAAEAWELSEELLPIAIFLYRGLCYSGYCNNLSKRSGFPTVYLASPGRMSVMSPILSSEAMKIFNYPLQEYSDLVSLLGLPNKGYNFTHIPVPFQANMSELTNSIYEMSPGDALEFVLGLRNSPAATQIRQFWANRILQSNMTCSVGVERSNVMANSTVYGNVNMVIHASPTN